jgi:hypothetical protein
MMPAGVAEDDSAPEDRITVRYLVYRLSSFEARKQRPSTERFRRCRDGSPRQAREPRPWWHRTDLSRVRDQTWRCGTGAWTRGHERLN